MQTFICSILSYILFVSSKYEVLSFSIHGLSKLQLNEVTKGYSIFALNSKNVPSSARSSQSRLFSSAELKSEYVNNEDGKNDQVSVPSNVKKVNGISSSEDNNNGQETKSSKNEIPRIHAPKEAITKYENLETPIEKKKRRKMELAWCGRESCTYFDDGKREKVVGDHNEIMFENPATGQVVYQWLSQAEEDDVKKDEKMLSRVLISIRKNDDELLKVASEVSLLIYNLLFHFA